jgi:branched-chain amino acid transport system substrate-binding protein
MKRRQFLRWSGRAGLFVAAPALWTRRAAAQARSSIRIGMSISSTGPFAHDAQSGSRAIKMWLDDTNGKGGLVHNGRRLPIELLIRDDRSDKQLVPRVYESLINDDKVDLVLGPYGSTLTAAAAAVTERYGIFMMGWAVAADTVFQQGYRFVVNGGTTPVSRVPDVPVQALKDIGGRVVSTIAVDEPYSEALATLFKAAAEKRGLRVGAMEKYQRGARDFTIPLQKAAAAGTDLFCITSYDSDMIAMLRQMKENDINFPAIFSGFSQNSSILALGTDAIGLWGQFNIDPRVHYPVTRGADAAGFLKAYQAKYPNGPEPDINTAVACAGTTVLGAVIEQATDLSAPALKRAALELSGKLTVLSGTYAIDETGQQTGFNILVLQNVAGGREVIAPAGLATAKSRYPMPTWAERG